MTTAIRIGRALLWLVYAWVVVTVVLLFLAFLLQLFGANPTAGFVQWVYRSTQRAMAPFRGIFEPVPLSDQSVLDTSILFAIIVYGFVAMGLNLAVDWVSRRLRASEARDRVDRDSAAHAGQNGVSQLVNLAGPSGASASAIVTSHGHGTAIDLTAEGLEPSQRYDAWLEAADGRRFSVGAFQADGAGTVNVSMTIPGSLADVRMFGVSPLAETGASGGAAVLAARLS
jgi:uncharacterized protein YggT (Ycf19 family)